jgi:putative beta-lysine N-acetyltransferase
MYDIVEKIDGSTMQHGKLSDRVYLMSMSERDVPGTVKLLDELADSNGYSKIFSKVPGWAIDEFTEAGHVVEAEVPGFYGPDAPAFFTGKFLDEQRVREDEPELVRKVLLAAEAKATEDFEPNLPDVMEFRPADILDSTEIAKVYRKVFDTYPFPIHDPEYVEETALSGEALYFGVWDGDNIAALSSSEIDIKSGTAEMTDFATLPKYRGRGLAGCLLGRMEEEMRALGVRVLYTIARAYSFGMNITFARDGYAFGGTLTNNTNISGRVESMNVWYKSIESVG